MIITKLIFCAAFGFLSPFWIPSSLVYPDSDNNFGTQFDPNLFDELEEPPPVHILYPRPSSTSTSSSSLHLLFLLIASIVFQMFRICYR